MAYLPICGEGEGSTTSGSVDAVAVEFSAEVEKIKWKLSEEKLRECAAAKVGDQINSETFKLPSGLLFSVQLCPKGYSSKETGFVSIILKFQSALNLELAGIEACLAQITFFANGKKQTQEPFVYKFNEEKERYCCYKVMRSPSFSPDQKFDVEIHIKVLKVTKSGKALALSVDDLFKARPFAEYRETLEREGYDTIEGLKLLDDEELQRIGVTRVGHRRLILKRLDELKET